MDAIVGGHIYLAENAAEFLGERLALILLEVEDGDLDAFGGEGAGGGRAEAGGAACDDRGDGVVELHDCPLIVVPAF
jgi:hypothetical protein